VGQELNCARDVCNAQEIGRDEDQARPNKEAPILLPPMAFADVAALVHLNELALISDLVLCLA
jgi:hypothetical protein